MINNLENNNQLFPELEVNFTKGREKVQKKSNIKIHNSPRNNVKLFKKIKEVTHKLRENRKGWRSEMRTIPNKTQNLKASFTIKPSHHTSIPPPARKSQSTIKKHKIVE